MTNYTYTEDDFRTARFATHPDGLTAWRAASGTHPWRTSTGTLFDHEHMATHGWVPVREANGRRDRNIYIDHLQEQDRIIRARNERIAELEAALAEARPQRKPWADLADMLRGTAWEQMAGKDADTIAETLHAQGVRVQGGDEK